MHSDYDGELHALRDIIAAMSGVVRTVGLAANINIDSLELAMTRWHKWRTERWGREVKDAEKVLQKASTISDYGIVDGTDKFVTQADVKALQRALQNALRDAEARRKKDAAFWCMIYPGLDTGCAGCPAETDGEICGKVPVVAHPKGNEVKELNAKLELVEKRLIEEQNYRVRVVDELQVRINELEKDRVEERRDHLADHNRVTDLTRVEDRRCEDNELMHIELDKLGAPRRGMNDVVYTPLGRIRAYAVGVQPE